MKCKLSLYHFYILPLGLGLSAFAYSSTIYMAKKGDVLSSIAQEKMKGPVWGKKGNLNSLLALNPKINNPDLIYPGQEIQLPDDVIAEATATQTRSVASVSPACEVKRAPAADEAAAPTTAVTPLTPPPAGNALIELSPYYGLSSISATDKATGNPASLASSINAGLDVHYYQLWSESFRTFIDLNLGTLSFEQPTDSTKSVQNSSTFMSGFGLGADFSLSSALTFRVFGEYQKEAFVRSASTDAVTVDAVSVPELGGRLSLDLLKKNSLTLGVSGDFSEFFQTATAGYTVLQGNEYGGALYFKQDVGGSALQTELGYFSRQQNTSITDQTERDFIVRFRG
jgi:LysM repeat protein